MPAGDRRGVARALEPEGSRLARPRPGRSSIVGEIESARTCPRPGPPCTSDEGRIHVDAGRGFGQVAARDGGPTRGRARSGGRNRVRDGGATSATSDAWARRSRGPLPEGCLALAVCNTGPAGGRVAPYGGRSALFGTNPTRIRGPDGLRPADRRRLLHLRNGRGTRPARTPERATRSPRLDRGRGGQPDR